MPVDSSAPSTTTPLREAIVAVLRRSGRVLVIRRGPAARRPGYWGLLTGTLEDGESQPAAVEREVHEEVGLLVAAREKVWESLTDDGRYRLHWWSVAERGGRLEPDGKEVSELRWVTAAEFAALTPTFPGDREFFERVLPTLGA